MCNGCRKSNHCLFDNDLYNADWAHRKYEESLRKSRIGLDLTKEELIALDELISTLIRKGQPLTHIYVAHKVEVPCTERTLYNYISKGYLSVRNIDMKRVVRYKKKKRQDFESKSTKERKSFI